MPPTAIANATSDTTLELRNITTNGAWTSPVTYDPNGNWLSVNAGSGDLIELKAENAIGQDTEIIDFVPSGPDVALPDMDASAITPTHTPATSTFRLDFPAGALKDNSFPLNALLYLEEDPTVSASQTVPSSGHVFALTISDSAVTAGDRAVLEVTDDYGNRAELHFVVGGGVPAAAGLSSFQGSATQTTAELSGLAGLTATGVLPYGRELVTGQGVHSMPGAAIDLAVVLSYRSGITLDGPVGQSWDWNLDARLEASGQDHSYLPGNGSSWGPFTPSGTNVWDSPKGIFSELTYDKTLGEYRLQDATGAALVFHGKSHLLIRTEDGYGNRIELIRNATDQVVEIRDDLDRRTLLHWYRNGRLAGLEDFTSRRVLLDYDSQGRLVTWTRADGSRLTWSYEGSAARLAEVRDASGKIVIKTEYAYDAGTGRYLVSKQWTPHNLNQGAPILYGDDPGGGVLVTDALGAERVYHFATSAPNHLESLEVRSNLNLRAPGGSYPAGGGDDPISWRTRFAVDPNNWQLSARWYEVEWPAPTGIVTDIEKESWSYESPNDPDPILRGRLKDHTLEGDQTTTGDDLTESWSYTPASHPWPTLHTDFQQRQTQLEYDAHGQLLRRWQEGITMAVGQGEPPYTIETRFAYDSRGRLEKEWRPNRLDRVPTNPPPSRQRTYYASGPQEGYLEKDAQADETGTEVLATTYTYDPRGNVLTRTDPAGSVWTSEYDLLGRLTKSLDPPVVLTHPSASSTPIQGETQYLYDGSHLTDVKRRYFDPLGNPGNGSTQPVWVTTTHEYDPSTGVQVGTMRDFEWDQGATPPAARRSRTEYLMDARGQVTATREFYGEGSDDYTERRTEYDERGLILRTIADPDHNTAGDEIETWYRYDQAQREVERFEPLWTESHKTFYNPFGRHDYDITPKVNLGTDLTGQTVYGYFKNESTYYASGLLQRTRRLSITGTDPDPSEPATVTSVTEYAYDQANRETTRKEAMQLDATGNPIAWAEWQTDLYPGGQTKRSYVPGTTPLAFTLATLDDLDRVKEVTDPVGTKRETVYDSTGLVERTIRTDIDDDPDAGESQVVTTTTYAYDALGRRTEAHELGDGTPVPIVSYTAIDGIGQVYQSWRAQGGTNGVATQRVYNLAGLATVEIRAKDLDPSKLHSRVESTYDLKGRLDEVSQVNTAADRRITSYLYDDVDRPLVISYPLQDASQTSRDHVYTYKPNGWQRVTDTDPNHVVKTTTYNDLGNPLSVAVDLTQAPPHIEGATLVEYSYGGASACGCARAGKPTRVDTTGGKRNTRVERTYDPRGYIESESISVSRTQGGTDWNTLTTVFEYDEGGNQTRIAYPVPTNAPATTLLRTLNARGRIISKWLDGPSPHMLTRSNYRGWLQAYREIFDTNGVTVVKGRRTLDALQRRTDISWTDPNDGPQGSTVLKDAVLAMDPDERITSRLQPNGKYAYMEYDGAGWLVREKWNMLSPGAGGGGNGMVDQQYDRNNYGEALKIEEIQELSTPSGNVTKTQDWSFIYDDAGGLEAAGSQVLVYSMRNCGIWNNERHVLESRAYTRDAVGRLTTFHYTKQKYGSCGLCDGWPGVISSFSTETETVTWTYKQDAWRRRTEAYVTNNKVGSMFNCDPPGTTNTWDRTTTALHEYVYDGLGRRAWKNVTSTPPDSNTDIELYHALAGTQIIQSQEIDSSGNTRDFAEYFYNQDGGMPDKYRIYLDPPGGSPTEQYSTNVSDRYSHLAGSNGDWQNGAQSPYHSELQIVPRTVLASGVALPEGDWSVGDYGYMFAERFGCEWFPGGVLGGPGAFPGAAEVSSADEQGSSLCKRIHEILNRFDPCYVDGWKTVTIQPYYLDSQNSSAARDAALARRVGNANRIWSQCCIVITHRKWKQLQGKKVFPGGQRWDPSVEYLRRLRPSGDAVPTIFVKGHLGGGQRGPTKALGKTYRMGSHSLIVLKYREGRNTLAHELGHVLALEHLDADALNLMFPADTAGETLYWLGVTDSQDVLYALDQCPRARESRYAK